MKWGQVLYVESSFIVNHPPAAALMASTCLPYKETPCRKIRPFSLISHTLLVWWRTGENGHFPQCLSTSFI